LLGTIAAAFDGVSASHHILAETPPGLVAWADPIPLHQVIGHLLDNAIKYSPNGGDITIRAARTDEDIQIDVIDEGIGLPDPEAIDVFEPFQRGDLNAIGATPGVGLGLHIVRTLVVSMGGSVTARPHTDRGSTVTICLPASQ
jgi:signal transduction histidine kinase